MNELWSGLGICFICLGIGGCSYLEYKGKALEITAKNQAVKAEQVGEK